MTNDQAAALASIDAVRAALSVAAGTLDEAARVLHASLADPVPVDPPPPPVEPPQVEPPAPVEPPVEPPAPVGISSRSLNMARILCWTDWLDQSRYQRFQTVSLLSAAKPTLTLRAADQAAGGANRAFGQAEYIILVDGVEHTRIQPTAGATKWTVPFDLTRLSEGWHWLDVVADGESVVPWFAYVQHGAAPVPQPFTPIVQGSYSAHGVVYWVNAPATYAPTPRPLAARDYPDTPATPARAALSQVQLVPWRPGDIYRPRDIGGGALAGLSLQAYFWNNLNAQFPTLPSFDGPRGVGAVSMATHLEVGKARVPITESSQPYFPGSVIGQDWFVGNVYFTDPWRFGKIRANGDVVTLAGWRHTQPMAYGSGNRELVGDWSAIPAERHGFRELWGLAWDERRQVRDPSGVPSADPRERGLVPHPPGHGAVVFLSDSQNNRVCRLEFSPTSHFEPPKVTEFLTGLADPWDVVGADGVLYVSERQAHRICAYSMDTGELLRVVVQGQALASVPADRKPRVIGTIEYRRAAPCVAPEGLFLQDGWLYFGSFSQAQVRRVHLDTGELQTVCDVYQDDNSRWVKFSVSDGSFGPRGMVAVTTWSNANYGRPMLYGTDGAPIGYVNTNSGGQGPGPLWQSLGYACAVGIGAGRMVTSSSSEGIVVIGKAQPSDKTILSGDWSRMVRDWAGRGFDLIHGHSGYGFHNLPLPWGTSDDVDNYLISNGHTK